MAGELHEVSRLLGNLETKIASIAEHQQTTHARLTSIEQKLSPVDGLVSDHIRMKAIQDRHEMLVNRGFGFVAAVGLLAGTFGVLIQQSIIWVARKMGLTG